MDELRVQVGVTDDAIFHAKVRHYGTQGWFLLRVERAGTTRTLIFGGLN